MKLEKRFEIRRRNISQNARCPKKSNSTTTAVTADTPLSALYTSDPQTRTETVDEHTYIYPEYRKRNILLAVFAGTSSHALIRSINGYTKK